MTVAAAKAKGFAIAELGTLGWVATCPTCPWVHIMPFPYKGDAAYQARAHNDEFHGDTKPTRAPSSTCPRPHWSLTDDRAVDLPERFWDVTE